MIPFVIKKVMNYRLLSRAVDNDFDEGGELEATMDIPNKLVDLDLAMCIWFQQDSSYIQLGCTQPEKVSD